LGIPSWQANYKVDKHGMLHGVETTQNINHRTICKRTEENTLPMMKSLVDIPNRPNVLRYENGTYQAGTEREFDAVLIYDQEKRIIAVYEKLTGNFVTTCELNQDEDMELKATGNFAALKNGPGGEFTNLTPNLYFRSDMTPVNTFESDVMKMTPMSPMGEYLSAGPGFTSLSSFESDVMGITPRDSSEFNNA
jgi:hypothetical protein